MQAHAHMHTLAPRTCVCASSSRFSDPTVSSGARSTLYSCPFHLMASAWTPPRVSAMVVVLARRALTFKDRAKFRAIKRVGMRDEWHVSQLLREAGDERCS